MTAVLGLDIGGTKIAGLLVDDQDRTLALDTIPTPSDDPLRLVQAAAALIADLLTRAGLSTEDLSAVGSGVPGRVDAGSGTVATAVNLNLDQFPLGQMLAGRLGVPVVVENDVRAAAVGAYTHLVPAAAVHSLAYLNLGTGVAAGVILNGRLYRGRRGMAGEIGHIVVDPGGTACKCGQRGCLETVIAGPALVARARALLPGTPVAAPDALYRAAAGGHQAAAAHVAHVSQHVARVIQWLAMTYDVDQILLGGGVTRMGAPFVDPVLAALDQLRGDSPLLATMLPAGSVQVLPADFNAGAWGAIALARTAVAHHPIDSQPNQEGDI